MNINEKKANKNFRSYSKNLTQFLIDNGLKPVYGGAHYWGVRISDDNGDTWNDFISIDEALGKFGSIFTKDELTSLRDESLNLDSFVRKGNTDIIIRKRVRFFKEFKHGDELSKLLNVWNDTKPK